MAHSELEALTARVAMLEARARRTRRLSTIAGVAVAFAALVGFAANGNCPNGLPVCFSADTPARASDINLNFATLKEWAERKTGLVGNNTIATDGGVRVIGSDVVIVGGNLDSPMLKTTSGGVLFPNNARVTSSGDAYFNSVNVNGSDGGTNVPHNCVVRQATGAATVACNAGEFVVGGGGDCVPGCALNNSSPSVFSNGRATGWAIDCISTGQFQGACISAPTAVTALCCQF
jgi:hypothetical protein